MSVVKFHTVDVNPALKQKTKLKLFIKTLFTSERKELAALIFIFCNDEYLLSLNKQFLQHDYFTDILTFDLSKNNNGIIGEIYISVDRVKENAANNDIIYLDELRRVIFHGALHLCGYLDKIEKEKALMTRMENYYLEQFKAFHVETR